MADANVRRYLPRRVKKVSPFVLLLAFAGAQVLAQPVDPPVPAASPTPSPSATPTPAIGRLTELSLEELSQVPIEVTSVSRKSESSALAPAAVVVLRRDSIRRAGALTIPDALRLSAGVHVAQIDSSKYAVGVRGFGSRLSRSLLVLVDGRSVYSPLFAGTYWEMQDVVFEDLDRIEVVRGPGGTLWGANAVNGVVNVITKPAGDTQGAYGSVVVGSDIRTGLSTRYGGRLGHDVAYRVWGRTFERDAAYRENGPEFDRWRMASGGFRTDGEHGRAKWMLQGGAFRGEAGQRSTFTEYSPPSTTTVIEDVRFQGAHALARWDARLGNASEAGIQISADHTERDEPVFREIRDTIDADAQHRFPLASWNEVIYGAGYRVSHGVSDGQVPSLRFVPRVRTDHLLSAFVQDSSSFLDDRLRFIIGTKIEHNDYTGIELHPSARVALIPRPDHLLWTSASRSLRTPSPVETDLEAEVLVEPSGPTYTRFTGNRNFRSEEVLALGAGYRADPSRTLRIFLAGFYNRYDRLLSLESGTPFSEQGDVILPVTFGNHLDATAHGGEGGFRWTPIERFSLSASFSVLRLAVRAEDGSFDTSSARSIEGSSPRHMATGGASFTLSRDLSLDGTLRWVDALPAQDVDAYVEADARLAWTIRRSVALSIVGRNLIHAHHAEYGGGAEIERSVFARVGWSL